MNNQAQHDRNPFRPIENNSRERAKSQEHIETEEVRSQSTIGEKDFNLPSQYKTVENNRSIVREYIDRTSHPRDQYRESIKNRVSQKTKSSRDSRHNYQSQNQGKLSTLLNQYRARISHVNETKPLSELRPSVMSNEQRVRSTDYQKITKKELSKN